MPTRKFGHDKKEHPSNLKSQNWQRIRRGNFLKYLSYREAWARIRQAQQQKFFLEAVTLEESIMTDRLICYLVITGAIEPAKELHQYPSFGQLITIWRQVHPQLISIRVKSTDFNNLQQSVNDWRKRRNLVVHGMVKSHPGTATAYIMDFLEEAKLAAKEGELLARAVSHWVRSRTRAI